MKPTAYEREQMRYEPHPDVWLSRRRESRRALVSDVIGGIVLLAVCAVTVMMWLIYEGFV